MLLLIINDLDDLCLFSCERQVGLGSSGLAQQPEFRRKGRSPNADSRSFRNRVGMAADCGSGRELERISGESMPLKMGWLTGRSSDRFTENGGRKWTGFEPKG